jgi:hypothetical protein
LRATLTELHRQLETAESIDPESAVMLRQAIADIEHVLSRRAKGSQPSPAEAGAHRSLVRRLTDAARGFEATHPMLSGAIGGVVDALAQMGI